MCGRTIAILGFHKIGSFPPGWESWFYVPEAVFVRFLTELHEEGWKVIDLHQFLSGLDEPETLPERSALLTFDDGYASMRKVALPLMQRIGVPGVLFVPTDYIGGRNTFDGGVEPDETICDWDDLRTLARAGVSIQSHGTSHRRFSELSSEEREQELARSKTSLEEQLGMQVNAIAFPYGDPGPSDEGRLLATLGYRAAFLFGGGPLRLPVADRYRLQRVAIGPRTDLRAELRRLT